MTMSAEQARSLLKELVHATGAKDVSKERAEYYIRRLTELPYERGRLAVRKVADNAKPGRFPALSEILTAADKVYGEGVANAGVYHATHNEAEDTDRLAKQAYDVWRQMHIERMPEDEYWDYVQASPKEKARIERQWREQYRAERRGGAA